MPVIMDELAKRRIRRELEKKLDPTVLQSALTTAGLFLVAYELLKTEIIDSTRRFFIWDRLNNIAEQQAEYQKEVLALDRNIFRASCLWLVRMEAISEKDMAAAVSIRDHRNEVAHELPNLLVDPKLSVDKELLEAAYQLLLKVGRFWVRLHIDTDPEYDGTEISDDEIMSGNAVLMGYIASMANQPQN